MADHETVFGLDLGRTMRFVATQPCVSSRSLDVTFQLSTALSTLNCRRHFYWFISLAFHLPTL